MICAYQKMSKKVGSWRIERALSLAMRDEGTEMLCHFQRKEKGKKKKLLAARRRNFYLSNKSWGFSIVRTMWHASWFSDSWIPTISDLCFCPRILELAISMGSCKQANYRVATILISLRFTYVSMITSVWGHAWKGLFFSSQNFTWGYF